jgi:hypothetical protein
MSEVDQSRGKIQLASCARSSVRRARWGAGAAALVLAAGARADWIQTIG